MSKFDETPQQQAIDDARWLVSGAADEFLELACDQPEINVAMAARLRQLLSAGRARLVLSQIRLRRHAREKFSTPARMFFTDRGLQQSTGEVVARYKASRFQPNTPVADLCCGIGGDLASLGENCEAIGIDRNPIMAIFSTANSNCQTSTADVSLFDVGAVSSWHIDPDRRSGNRRTTNVEHQDPDDQTLNRLLLQNPSAAIKLAPAAEVPENWAGAAQLEWISHRRQCRQLVVWHGDFAGECSGKRTATRLADDGSNSGITGDPNRPVEIASAPEQFVFEPDPAVLAAHLKGELAARYQLSALAPGIAYLTGSRPVASPLLSTFEIREVMPFRLKRLKAYLREAGIGRLEVKKRGVPHDPAELERQLRGPGHDKAVLLLYGVENQVKAIIAKRIL